MAESDEIVKTVYSPNSYNNAVSVRRISLTSSSYAFRDTEYFLFARLWVFLDTIFRKRTPCDWSAGSRSIFLYVSSRYISHAWKAAIERSSSSARRTWRARWLARFCERSSSDDPNDIKSYVCNAEGVKFVSQLPAAVPACIHLRDYIIGVLLAAVSRSWDTSTDCGHRCTDLRSIAGNRRYRLLAEWKYRSLCLCSMQSRAGSGVRACTRITHVQAHTAKPTKYLRRLPDFFSGRVPPTRVKVDTKHLLRTLSRRVTRRSRIRTIY